MRTLPGADYRPPIQRGDLDRIGPGNVVGIVDGVFAERLAISPGEIREAIERGVTIYGASSMGALRAAEIPRVIGIGLIYEMFRGGSIERDDEVALLFDPETYRPLTEPLINVRYAVDRLVRSGTIARDRGASIVEACAKLHYTQRTYPEILRSSARASDRDGEDLVRLLRTFDLKRDDAQFLLETLAQIDVPSSAREVVPPAPPSAEIRVQASEDSHARIVIWESGDVLELAELTDFLAITGTLESHLRQALARLALGGTPLRVLGTPGQPDAASAQDLLDATRLVWGWESPEEAHVTMRDLGLGLVDVTPALEAEAAANRSVLRAATAGSRVVAKALRAQLWLDDLALKREAMRAGALRHLARVGHAGGPPTERELDDARRTIARLRSALQWSVVRDELAALGMSDSALEQRVDELALARRAAKPIVAALDRPPAARAISSRAGGWRALGLPLSPCAKPHGTSRFSLSLPEANAAAEQIAKQIGIVRIGMVGELDVLGIHVAQAFGERSGWSSSFASGKAETREGARVGSIMEEVEIHAQDAYRPEMTVARFADAARAGIAVDPADLDLPYDTRYRESVELAWSPCIDLLTNEVVRVPTACLLGERLANDPYYSPRLGGKIFSSSGLGSGFSLAEAAVHASAELIERHAVRLAELEIDNPGKVGVRDFWFVDLESLPETPKRLVDKYRAAGMTVRVLDITSEIAVPTFYARVFDDPFDHVSSRSSDGFACHPDPEVAITMALLEAAQTKAGVIAGGREDYSLQARSLGRHERPRTMVPKSQVFWFCNDRPTRPLAASGGIVVRDILEELEWIVDRVEDAGYPRMLVADLTMPAIRPACAVRVAIPGIETTNPLFTGARGRATLVRDLLPRSR